MAEKPFYPPDFAIIRGGNVQTMRFHCMNYGKRGVKQKRKALQSTSSKLDANACSPFPRCRFYASLQSGLSASAPDWGFQGIIDSAPTITLEDATPTRYSSFIYDSKGNQMEAGSPRTPTVSPLRWIRFPPIWQTPLSPSRMSVFTSTTVSTSWGFSRAGVTAVKTGFKRQEGASTIFQQLIKIPS